MADLVIPTIHGTEVFVKQIQGKLTVELSQVYEHYGIQVVHLHRHGMEAIGYQLPNLQYIIQQQVQMIVDTNVILITHGMEVVA